MSSDPAGTAGEQGLSGGNNGLSAPANQARRAIVFGLSAKLLLLTAAFVMLAEVLIFVPSVANFRKNWLMERLSNAQIAVLATEAAPGNNVPNRLRDQLLTKAQVLSIAIRRSDARLLVLQSPMPGMVEAHFDLDHETAGSLIGDALYVFISAPDRLIRVMGKPALADYPVEIVMSEAPLKAAIYRYGLNILGLSIAISLIAATLVYLSLNALLVRPVSRLIRKMIQFRENPEDVTGIAEVTARRDEIGIAQEALSAMQKELIALLRQKSRLAALGLAVSKINHDLRNMLSSAQLMSDSLSTSRDATVQRFAPKLIASLDRAITFCTETLRYGRAEEAEPLMRRFLLHPLAFEVGENLGLPIHRRIRWVINIDRAMEVMADRSQVSRILTNLVRNAVQVLEAPPEILRPEIILSARNDGDSVVITVEDNGPGVPARARANLFQAFQGSVRAGGTGLGLAISAELTRAHGGEIWLDDKAPGTAFHVRLPSGGHDTVDSSSQMKNFGNGILAFGRPKH